MKYKINKDVILQKLDGKLVGFDVERSFLYTFNETAEFIFKKIKMGWDEKKIALSLAKKYQVLSSVALKDISILLKDLTKNKIITKQLAHGKK